MKKFLSIALFLSLILSFAACGGGAKETAPPATAAPTTAPPTATIEPTDPADKDKNPESNPDSSKETPDITQDRDENPITLPESVERVMCFGPATNEVILAIGESAKLIAIDTYSADIENIDLSLPQFDMMEPDAEKILSLEPDIIFVTGMSRWGGNDPYKPISDAGICVIYIPSSSNIEAIKEDILFVAAVFGKSAEGKALVAEMETEIAAIESIGSVIAEKKKVYFEIGESPSLYSFGTGVFLNEMLEIIGAENIFAAEKEWISIADEQILGANPDVILTTVYYIDDPIGAILSRPGWDAINAIAANDVYYIDANASNRPNHNIVKALREMALAVYPDLYGFLSE